MPSPRSSMQGPGYRITVLGLSRASCVAKTMNCEIVQAAGPYMLLDCPQIVAYESVLQVVL